MSKKSSTRESFLFNRWLWASVILGLVVVVAVVWTAVAVVFSQRVPSSTTRDIATDLPSSDIAFNVGTRVGQSAPAFSLPDAEGQPYAFKPGDGRKYLLAFNMGYA